jgi:hypothetical protein
VETALEESAVEEEAALEERASLCVGSTNTQVVRTGVSRWTAGGGWASAVGGTNIMGGRQGWVRAVGGYGLSRCVVQRSGKLGRDGGQYVVLRHV